MLSQRAPGSVRFGRLGVVLVFATALLVLATPVSAFEFGKGKVKGSWDTTVSFGVSYRLEDPDPSTIGLANGGTAFSVNGDDGNLNYEVGVFSLVPKINTELGLDFGEHFGVFLRGFAFYDYENEDGDRARTPLSDGALERVGSRAELRDAFLWTRFSIGNKPAQVRAGEHVLSWGESTFIQGGINVINPVDVSALRVPGAELKEALLPVGMVSGSFTLTTNLTVEGFYQYRWEEIKVDPPGSYFSTNDFAGAGGETVFLGFGSAPDIPPFQDPTAPTRPFLGVSRESDLDPDDGGQYGIALRWFLPALGNTEMGLYYLNYHSRLPLINGRTGTISGAQTAGLIGNAATPIAIEVGTQLAGGATIPEAIAAGTAVGVGLGAPQGASLAIAGTAATGGNVAAVTTAFATDAYAQTARYFVSYPEDIELFGLSLNAQLGTSGIAFQTEVSYRPDAPLQADDVELLFAALAPINPVFAGNSGIPGEPGESQLSRFQGEDYSTQFETVIPGSVPLDLWQWQGTLTKIFGPGLGAAQSVLLCEIGATYVPDLPDHDVLRFEGAGTYTSGNPYHENGANPGAAHAGKPAESSKHFADSMSWGYRLVGRLDYLNAIGAVSLSPSFGWQHDVSGVAPGPGGNFIEDRKAATIGITANYQNAWSGDLSYTRYFGAGRHNLINDRDFLAANVKYSF
jgi:hypothetical protein